MAQRDMFADAHVFASSPPRARMNPTQQLATALADRYLIGRQIGAGGMATVYIARDVKHNRDVALKVLKPELGAVLGVDRFLAEIQVTAKLLHPNLLPLFDSGEANGLLFYVMPFVEGEALRARLEREKQLPVDEAVRLGCTIAHALDYAHRHGVIHRDLKPENVLLHEGQPLVTDFGIALAVSNAGGNRITQTGLSLGTPQYMSPEQATGDRTLDARTDVYSLGAIIYEMLGGDPPHTASTSQAIIAKVLTERPPSVRLTRPTVPEHVEYAVMRALEKLPADRWASGAELAAALEGKATVRSTTISGVPSGEMRAREARRTRRLASAAIGALVAGAAIGAWVWDWTHPRGPNGTVRFSLTFPAALAPTTNAGRSLSLTPDGRQLIYRTETSNGTRLARRPMDQLTASVIAGTEDVVGHTVSPDGKWIAFLSVTGPTVSLKKVPIDGGAPTTLWSAAVGGIGGPHWGSKETIVFAGPNGRQLRAISASGSVTRVIARPDTARGEVGMRQPRLLNDGRTVVYTSFQSREALIDGRIAFASLDGGTPTILDVHAAYILGMIDGFLVYQRSDGPIMAVAIDVKRRRAIGEPVVLLEGVAVDDQGARVALSEAGILAYEPGRGAVRTVALLDSRGTVTPLFEPRVGRASSPAVSRDGKQVAVGIGDVSHGNVWVYNLTTRSLIRLNPDSAFQSRPVWSHDGRVLYFSDRELPGARPRARLWAQVADGSAPATVVAEIGGQTEAEPTPDGLGVVFRAAVPNARSGPGSGGQRTIFYKNFTGDTSARMLVPGTLNDQPSLSPDGRWLAYRSAETGSGEVYVRSLFGRPAKFLVSLDGGSEPRWARDGKAIYYRSANKLVMASVTTRPTFAVSSRRALMPATFASNTVHQAYDVTPDGRFVVVASLSTDSTATVVVVVNWVDEVRAKLSRR